jgi:hypothetical protein
VIALAETANVLSTVLLPLASALLLEELTYGGLVRLLLAPKPGAGAYGAAGGKAPLAGGRRQEPNQPNGGRKCSH